jgi:hypothetical protein
VSRSTSRRFWANFELLGQLASLHAFIAAGAASRSGVVCQSSATELLDVFFKASSPGIGVNGDANWSSWLKPHAPRHLATGPPGGIVLPSGRILIEYYSMGP